ncbi:MAG: FctA domain-containing protein, partial [Coriobacteriales bacterium]|nr:FctA domain-containing protein [Coriobacteriales bacterium]
AFEVTKQFNNWDNAKTNTFSFKLTPEGDAPMPQNTLMAGEDVRPVSSDNHTATFGSITFTREGTYAYKLSEVVPTGADENGVFEGIAYDTTEHDVMVNVTADEDGALHAKVVYDVAQPSLTITNTYEATGSTTLTGTKVLAGRPFREGDTWTFAITQPEGQNGPVPEHESVTVDAFADATIDFGTIGDFTFEDVGKTFTYEVSESGSVEDVANDAQVKTVTLTIEDNGDGTLNVVNSAEDEKTPLTFTNTYLVHEDLVAYKGITGRKWYTNDKGEVAEEYSFELYDAGDASARKREESKVSNKAITHGANHTAKFGTFTFTHEDVGSVFGYTVREVSVTDEQAEQGMTVDAVMYDVTFEVVEQDGEVKVLTNYSYGVDKEGNTLTKDRLEFVNSYKAKPTKATIQAQKVLQGRDIKDGEFAFELYSVASDGTRFKQQTKSVSKAKDSEPSVVTFDDIDCVEAGTMNYVIKEVIPQDAVEDKDGNWKKDGITYDATEHKVKVVTTDDYEGQLHAEVVYEDLEQGQTMPVLTNTYFGALANIEFDKAYYGTNDTAQFEFILTAADKDFAPREANNSGTITYDPASITQQTPLVDFGQAFSIVQTNGAFKNNLAKVSMPTITYHEPGTYYYVISENADGQNANLSSDQASILVTVDVNEKAKASVSYQIRDDEDVTEVAKDAVATLYNNEMITLGFRSRALRQLNAQARVASYQPTVRKVLKNGVLKGGEFQFALYEGTDTTGQPLQVVSNDVNGAVSFDAITYTDANVGQTYTYTIVEQPSSDETVVIDDHAIRLAIKVSEGAEGQIVVEGTYSDVDQSGALTQTTDPTFVNNYDTIVIHAVKRSREEPYDPLPGAHYGLWMVNPDGEDVYMGLGRNQVESEGAELVSSENGDLYYDLPLLEGVAYYFLEEWPPPAGHLVDPYPTDYFTLVHDKEAGTFRLVYEADADFAKYCPGITR